MVGRVPSRGALSRIQAQYEISGLVHPPWTQLFPTTLRSDFPQPARNGQPRGTNGRKEPAHHSDRRSQCHRLHQQ